MKREVHNIHFESVASFWAYNIQQIIELSLNLINLYYSGMFTSDTRNLTIWYFLRRSGKKNVTHLIRGFNGSVIYFTVSGNVHNAWKVMPLVTMISLIHWIQRAKFISEQFRRILSGEFFFLRTPLV